MEEFEKLVAESFQSDLLPAEGNLREEASLDDASNSSGAIETSKSA
jgi:hypothetical protein